MSESFTKLSHPSLLQSVLNPTSDSSSTCSFPSFGQYMSPSRPNDFSEIRPDDSGSNAFGGVQERSCRVRSGLWRGKSWDWIVFCCCSESSLKTVKSEPRKKLKVDKKQSVRGRKSKDSMPGEPPHLTSPPPPSDFTSQWFLRNNVLFCGTHLHEDAFVYEQSFAVVDFDWTTISKFVLKMTPLKIVFIYCQISQRVLFSTLTTIRWLTKETTVNHLGYPSHHHHHLTTTIHHLFTIWTVLVAILSGFIIMISPSILHYSMLEIKFNQFFRSLPTSMEELLESQWRLGSQFLMQQGQRLDSEHFCIY